MKKLFAALTLALFTLGVAPLPRALAQTAEPSEQADDKKKDEGKDDKKDDKDKKKPPKA